MTKQTTTTAAPEEKPSVELLLKRFKLMDKVVEDVRRKTCTVLVVRPLSEIFYNTPLNS